MELLRAAGHQVSTLLPPPVAPSVGAALRAARDTLWATQVLTTLRRRLRLERPHVLHAHNLFPSLSPGLMRTCATEGVPVVLTLHNFRLLCLPAVFLRDGSVCEDCLGRFPWRGVVHGCYRGSRGQSLVLAASLGVHRTIGSFDRVARFLAVSSFVRDKHVAAGIAPERILVKPNFAWPASRREEPGRHFLFLGRLSPEKGLAVVLSAWKPEYGTLLVAGDGNQARELRALAGAGVKWLGAVPPQEARRLVGGARAVLVPSICYEAFPRAVVEAYAAGVPVIASRIGALPEVVEDAVTGLLAPPGDPSSWAQAIEKMLDNSTSERLGRGAHDRWAERYSPEKSLMALETAYREAIGQSDSSVEVAR